MLFVHNMFRAGTGKIHEPDRISHFAAAGKKNCHSVQSSRGKNDCAKKIRS